MPILDVKSKLKTNFYCGFISIFFYCFWQFLSSNLVFAVLFKFWLELSLELELELILDELDELELILEALIELSFSKSKFSDNLKSPD